MLWLMSMCVWNLMWVWISYRSLWQKWNFISGDKISCKHYPKWNAYTCPSKSWPFWNAGEMKLHVNRTCFHGGLKSQTGLSSFRLSCERTLRQMTLQNLFQSTFTWDLEVNSNCFEISNCFEKSFCLHDDFTEVKSQTGLSSLGVSCKRALRSSPTEVFLVKGVLKICSKFMEEHPCRSAICKATLLKSYFGMFFSCKISNHFEMSFRLRGNLHGDFTPATFQTMARHAYRSTFTWDPMWTQTSLRFNFRLKFHMDVR